MSDTPAVIGYYVLAGISVLCSVFVVSTLWMHGSLKTNSTRLILCLHIAIICEEISALPYAYNANDDLCEAIAFLHFYFGLSSIVAIGFLVISYRYHFFTETVRVSTFIKNWSIILVVVIPLITLLPFISRSYDTHKGPWCAVSGKKRDHSWAFGVFFAWVWVILGSSAFSLSYTMIEIYNIDPTIGRKMFSTVGMYSIISIVTWIPRTAAQIINFRRGSLTTNQWLYSYIPLYIAGILYTMVFLTEKKALILFDRAAHTDQGIDAQTTRDRAMSGFSWEGSDSFRFTSTGRGNSVFMNSLWRNSHSGALRLSTATGNSSLRSMTSSSNNNSNRNSLRQSLTTAGSSTATGPAGQVLGGSNTRITLTRSPLSVGSTDTSLSSHNGASTDGLDGNDSIM